MESGRSVIWASRTKRSPQRQRSQAARTSNLSAELNQSTPILVFFLVENGSNSGLGLPLKPLNILNPAACVDIDKQVIPIDQLFPAAPPVILPFGVADGPIESALFHAYHGCSIFDRRNIERAQKRWNRCLQVTVGA